MYEIAKNDVRMGPRWVHRGTWGRGRALHSKRRSHFTSWRSKLPARRDGTVACLPVFYVPAGQNAGLMILPEMG